MRSKRPMLDREYILEKLLELAYDGIVVVDANGAISMISKAYADFLGVRPEDVIGEPVENVIENTRLPVVLKTGETEKAQLQMINGDYMVASRFPLIKDGSVVGAIGKVLFRNIDELNVLHRRIHSLQSQLDAYRSQARTGGTATRAFDQIIGASPSLRKAKTMAEKAGETNSSVLLMGESGTGKELFAHAIHQASRRATEPMIKINCSAIPAELLESELFGYEGGAFTGARKNGKIGKFEAADGGTLFLDEIGDTPPAMQAKLLRVLQEGEIEKIGARNPIKVDTRIITATNMDLEDMVAKGRFRADLFYRLNVIAITIPPLRERVDDVEILVPKLLETICARVGKYVEDVSPQTLHVLKRHPWPGNVRQLENALERAVNAIESEPAIEPRHLPEEISGIPAAEPVPTLREATRRAEKQAILAALRQTGGKKNKAARLLGISRSNLYRRLDELQSPSWPENSSKKETNY